MDSVAARLRRGAPEKKLVLEARTIAEALAAAEAGFDVIQAEKFSPADIALLVKQLAVMTKRPKLAAAGGVNRRQCGRICGSWRGYPRHIGALCCAAARRLCPLYAQ